MKTKFYKNNQIVIFKVKICKKYKKVNNNLKNKKNIIKFKIKKFNNLKYKNK